MTDVTGVFESVIEELMSRDLTPSVESCMDVNEGYCGVVAAEVYERLGEPSGMRLCRAGTHSEFHYWVEFDGEFYDAERPEGVLDWRVLPFWSRYGSPSSEFEYEAWVKHMGL